MKNWNKLEVLVLLVLVVLGVMVFMLTETHECIEKYCDLFV